MSKGLISVITPAYNSASFIGLTINSVINQTYIDWELIIIDDGSTDSTAMIVKEYQGKDPRIKYIYQRNQGQGLARNAGLRVAEGDLVAFLDSDDLWLPDKLEKSVELFYEKPIDLLFTDAYVFHEDEDLNGNIKELPVMKVENKVYFGTEAFSLFLYCNRVPTLTVLVKKKSLLQVGGFREFRGAEDYLMWLYLLLNGCRFKGVSTPYSLYREHSESISSKDRYGFKYILQILDKLKYEYPEVVDYSLYEKHWTRFYVENIFKREDLSFLKGLLIQKGLYSQGVRLLFAIRPFIKFRRFKRKLAKKIK